uniref:Uncharacterized protein n=1 Tax=Entomoneis paludosa TaxID=265537 RepID=A0A7S2VBB1_9STRA|mmetsp:Transcript_13098/g.27154  ORF Transcript_13098/g.27154 Transcript_13098/m.27154 type:complete len:213 (+) Transcript_13098:111-749(+)
MSLEKGANLADEYRAAVALVDQGDATTAVTKLESLQERIARASILSRNESLDDIATSNIPFLTLEHELAKALTQLPIVGGKMTSRLSNLKRACDLWMAFFQNLENMEQVSKGEQAEYHALIELSSTPDDPSGMPMLSTSRDAKIARYNAKKQTQQELKKLQALLERRTRLGLDAEDMDGHDQESLERSLALKSMEFAKQDAVEEWSSVVQGT